jgi:Outer membrane protein beta-barrel domain
MEALMQCTTAVLLSTLLAPAAARAQSPVEPVVRADVAVSTGWLAVDRSIEGSCCSSWSSGLHKGVSAGYYWTDHLKTEAGVADPGTTEAYGSFSERLANGSFRYTSEHYRYEGTTFSIAQIYQYGRNATFHPFVIGGVDVERERDTIDRYVSTSAIGSETERVETSMRTRAFAGAGFKAYFSERAFFQGEARFAGIRSPLQMTWTAGVGVDLGGARRPAAATEARAPRAAPRGAEPPDVWRAYVSRLPTGSLVDVTPAGSDRFIATLVAVDADGILLKPLTRVAEPVRHVAFDRLETLALHDGPPPGARVGATLAGVGAGAGTFTLVLLMLLSHFGG